MGKGFYSTLLPSMYAEATGRPDRFAAMHFHGYVWISNVVDIMVVDIIPHPGTAETTLDLLEAFARRIGQVPICLSKETHGNEVYCLSEASASSRCSPRCMLRSTQRLL
jgi:3-hydroxyacyl-CoA dehydrogenase